MFNRQQQVFLQTGVTVLVVFFLVRIGGLDAGPAILWGLLVGFVFMFWRRQDMLVENGRDVFAGTLLEEMFSPESQPWTPPQPGAAKAARRASEVPSETAEKEDHPEPAKLNLPQSEPADDLKQISGVGPKLEQQLNAMGIRRYEQIASWTPEQVARFDEELPGLKGRVSRDGWVDQAKSLATGSMSS